MKQAIPQGEALSILTHAPAETVKDFADRLLPALGNITVIKNRTGLVMLPYTDSGQGTVFHLGEVLVAEAHIRTEAGVEGYGMVTGRDTVFALGVAVIDAAMMANLEADAIQGFLQEQKAAQSEADDTLLRHVEATRVEMETF